MFRLRWMHNLLDVARSRKDRRRAARNCKSIRLRLESLEERLMPSGGNPTVTQTAGSYTALTAAIATDVAPNINYVIEITGSFQFNSGGQVSISKLGSGSTLALEGQNDTNYTLTGNGNRLFDIASGQNVTFENLTLTGGSVTNSKGTAQGGAILDQGGNVTLSQVTVQGNTVKGATAEGGGVFASGAGVLAIHDSILSDNSAQGSQGGDGTAPGMNGGAGGSAFGGGLYVAGSGWTVTLIGDTLSGNTAIGGNGGNGAAGSNATGTNAQGGTGGNGGYGGEAWGGAAFFSNYGNGRLTILNDQSAPITDPSTWIDNSAQAGAGGAGGAGGNSTGTAYDSNGGFGGGGARAFGGAVYVYSGTASSVSIGNSAFYANEAAGGNDGRDGLPGTGGQPNPPPPPLPEPGGDAVGGGLALSADNVTIVNSTVAANTAIGGVGEYGGTDWPRGYAWGGGIYAINAPIHDPPPPQPPSPPASIFVNNTITQNTVDGGGNGLPPPQSSGAGVFVGSSNATIVNNLIQGNRGIGSFASDLDSGGATLGNASNDFIGTISANAVSTTTNIVGNTQVQLGTVVGVDANGKPTGGPIYYPVLTGAVSVGTGATSVLNTIAGVEGITSANATDEIGNPRSSNGAINLGAVEIVPPPPSPPSPPPSAPPAPPALHVPPLLAFLDSLLGGTETVNANGTETITDRLFGIPLLVSTFDSDGNLMSADLFGFFDILFLFV